MAIAQVSVIIPTFNSADYLKGALNSLISQTYPHWEAIVIDNFSNDHTLDVVSEFADRRIRIIQYSNNGIIGAARNRGLELASSPWVAFLDADDLWDPEKLEKCLNLAASESVGLLAHGIRTLRTSGETKTYSPRTITEPAYVTMLRKGNLIYTSGVMVRRDWLTKVSGFSEESSLVTVEDFDLWLRLSRAGCRFVTLSEVLGTILISDSSASRNIEKHLRANIELLSHHINEKIFGKQKSKKILKQAMARVEYGAGRTFQRRGMSWQAGQLYRASLRKNPFQIKLYVALMIIGLNFFVKPRPE